MSRWRWSLLAAGAIVLTATTAQARQAGVWGAGAQSCANWAEARSGTTLWKDYFEGWVLGYLSDANVRRYSVRDPNPALGDLLHGKQPETLFKSIDAACEANPGQLVVTATAQVVGQLITAEDMNAAVIRP